MKSILEEKMPFMVKEIENLFGPSVEDFTFTGIVFPPSRSQNAPCIFFPYLPEKTVTILISRDCLADRDTVRAEWQLAHECVHLLSPTGKTKAIFLEEGMVSYFQDEYILNKYEKEFDPTPCYAKAKRLFMEIHNVNQYAIKEIRKECPVIDKITKEMLFKHCRGLKNSTAEELLSAFPIRR